jgi:SAM-dependent methyltransferase
MSTPKGSGRTGLQPYWDEVSGRYAPADPLAAVCYPGAPPWFNRFIGRFQALAVARALADLPLQGARALDVGCGMGRWTRWLHARGARVTGVDPTAEMLDAARRLSPDLDYRRMSATAIGLGDAEFDLVTAVTVVQHLSPEEQRTAMREIARVLRPGGHALLLDLIDLGDRGPVVFPRAPGDWISLARDAGLDLVAWRGQEFIPLIRAGWALADALGRRPAGEPSADATGGRGEGWFDRIGRRPGLRLLLLPLRVLVLASYPLEWLCERFAPARWARHGCFLYRRREAP